MKGFTLIEVMVSVAIFSVVMTIALGSLLAMSSSDRRAEALKSVVNNLNFALDSMGRSIRTGYSYHCDSTGDLTTPAPADCNGSTVKSYFAYVTASGSKVAYCLDSGVIKREVVLSGALDSACTNANANFLPITSSEVNITRLQFIVIGATDTNIQPKVTILLSGAVKISGVASSTFNLETSLVQRIYDQ